MPHREMVHLLQTSLQTWYRHCYSTTLPVLAIIIHECESSVHLCLKYHCVLQVNGKVQSGPDLSVTHFSGLELPNPFVIGSGRTLPAHNVQSHPATRQYYDIIISLTWALMCMFVMLPFRASWHKLPGDEEGL